MSNQRKNRLPQILIGQLSVTLFIFIISVALIFYAQGWRINLKNFKFYKTGLIFVSVNPKPDTISIEDKTYIGENQFSINLVPGNYDIKISKNNYVDWFGNIKVYEEMVSYENSVQLFLDNPQISDLTDQSKIDFLNSPETVLAENAKNKLAFNKYEIWTDKKLVTRFSEPIYNVKWYPDTEHILYQQNDQIRIIDANGLNEVVLVTLSNPNPTKFAVGAQGKELYYLDNSNYKKAVIQ